MASLLSKAKHLFSWKNLIATAVLMVTVVVLRYFVAAATFFGVSSPLTYNVSAVKYALRPVIYGVRAFRETKK